MTTGLCCVLMYETDDKEVKPIYELTESRGWWKSGSKRMGKWTLEGPGKGSCEASQYFGTQCLRYGAGMCQHPQSGRLSPASKVAPQIILSLR